MLGSLRPSTQRVLTLVAKVRALQKDKEHLRINLTKAEEEVRRLAETVFFLDYGFLSGHNLNKIYMQVKLLFEENNVLDAENKKLLKQHHRERNLDGSGGKHTTSASAKV